MQYIYSFKQGLAEGSVPMQAFLGGKGAYLAAMCNLSLPVPPGFTLTTDASKFFSSDSHQDAYTFNIQFKKALEKIEKVSNTSFGSCTSPCLLSIRSGAEKSMPGMMDTILNLGLNDEVIGSLLKKTENPFFVYDLYRRFIQIYSVVVLKIESELFEEKYECLQNPTEADLEKLCYSFKQIVKEQKKQIPENVHVQLRDAIKAVYASWNSCRAVEYRKINNISEDNRTAVTVQRMVFGNKNDSSLAGVLLSRDCLTGKEQITGEYLIKGQGEDIVSGTIIPYPLSLYSSKEIAQKIGYTEKDRRNSLISLEEINPILFEELKKIAKQLEMHYKHVQDIEFTVEDGKLWILQTRTAKTTKKANLIIQKNLFMNDIITEDVFFERTQRYKLEDVGKFKFKNSEEEKEKLLGIGMPVSAGLATGQIAFSSEEATQRLGTQTILVREQTDTHDLAGISASKGVLTAKGGSTSHAAVVCRGANICCVVGANIKINLTSKTVIIGDETFKDKDWISLDGDSGKIFKGRKEIYSKGLFQ